MLRLKKNRSIVMTLRDRETCSVTSPHYLSLNVLSQLIRSDDSHYKNQWTKVSSKPMTYDNGNLYCENYSSTYTIHGSYDRPHLLYHLQTGRAKKRIVDVITYSAPIAKDFDDCFCGTLPCVCLSRFLMSLSEDNWLCQHNEPSGRLFKEIYVNRFGSDFCFKHCDWDIYGERVILTSALFPNQRETESQRSRDVVVNLAVFKVFPLEFYALLEIKRSVFGPTCSHVNVSDQHLILGISSVRVHIYNFSELLENGKLEPYKLGQQYGDHGKVGNYPTGLPLNFNYSSAPPLLFNVQCFGQVVSFGGFPYHYVVQSPKDPYMYNVKSVAKSCSIRNGSFQSRMFNEEPDAVMFHPDNSNRLIFRDSFDVDVYEIVNYGTYMGLSHCFNMTFPQKFQRSSTTQAATHSSYGREIRRKNELQFHLRTIFSLEYEDELNLLAILGVHRLDPLSVGFVKLYDSVTGEEVKTIKLAISLCETKFYQLYFDLANIIILERGCKNVHRAFHYGLEFS